MNYFLFLWNIFFGDRLGSSSFDSQTIILNSIVFPTCPPVNEQTMRQPHLYSLKEAKLVNFSEITEVSRGTPSGKKKVAFSQNDEIRTFKVDLRLNDEAFILEARHLMALFKKQLQSKQKSPRWLPSFLYSESSNMEFDEKRLDDFKYAFEYRVEQLPDCKKPRSSRVDSVMREFARIVESSGWHGKINDNETNETGRRNMPEILNPTVYEVEDPFYTEVQQKRCEVEMFSEEVRKRVVQNFSVETLLSEMRNLQEITHTSKNKKMIEYCTKEIQTIENMLEDMGYTRAQNKY